jgi:DNA-binding response OmpR family regulator
MSDQRRKKVVVIGEDDAPIATLLRDAINDESGYQAVVVSDGALVLETVRQVKADLLILDIMMPGLDGFEVYDRLRQDSATAQIPVLFLSAAASHFEDQFTSRHITDVMRKPFDLNDFIGEARRLCPPDDQRLA